MWPHRVRARTVRRRAVLSLPIVFLLASGWQALGAQGGYVYRRPVQTDDGWHTASLRDVGMDTGRMVEFMNTLASRPEHWLHSVVVVKDGRLVFEEYFAGSDGDLSHLSTSFGPTLVARAFDRDTPHLTASVSKSVTSILVGIAIDEGLVGGTDETLLSFFPDYAQRFDSLKGQITLDHMLTMTSGLSWSEARGFDDPRNDLTAMMYRPDPIGYVLEKSAVAAPGEQFIYNSGTVNLLGEIVRRRSGMTLADFAARYLFAPLGITQHEWYALPSAPEMTIASSSLYLRPRDMAKIGQLYLDGGMWGGTRVVSDHWVTRSTQLAVQLAPFQYEIPISTPGYGFLWWLGTFPTGNARTYFAAGFGGQFIFVLPAQRMVVVITAGGFEDFNQNYRPMVQIVNDYVLRATDVR
ncbi:MAG: serine hydrolase [Gemmatimonadales bacterium]|nr:serine hydrolase [Gemmatimonadales bacterium]